MQIPEEYKSLLTKKEQIETSIAEYTDYLNQPGMPGLKGGLVDAEGFPRADIDLYAVQEARGAIARLQNDHRSLMQEIERLIMSMHASGRVAVPREKIAGGSEEGGSKLSLRVGPPFGSIEQVFENSPASNAGIQIGDRVRKFGNVDLLQFKDVSACFEELPKNVRENEAVELLVERSHDAEGSREKKIQLIPKKWDGRGLLGVKEIMPPTLGTQVCDKFCGCGEVEDPKSEKRPAGFQECASL